MCRCGTLAEAADAVIKRAEKRAASKAASDVRQSHGKSIHVSRSPNWFEKFRWFISTDGVVVVAGSNAQQNELLVKRYLRPQDIYVHADLHGAATCIVRSPSTRPEDRDVVPPTTLEQAGQFTVCLSAAWKAHMPTRTAPEASRPSFWTLPPAPIPGAFLTYS